MRTLKPKPIAFAAWVSVAERLVFAMRRRTGDLKNVCGMGLTNVVQVRRRRHLELSVGHNARRGNDMPDITMCPGLDCPLREKCYRYTAEPNKWRQSFADFTKNVREVENSCGEKWYECADYVPNTGVQAAPRSGVEPGTQS